MVKVYPIVGVVLSVIALILLSVGVSTNRWITIENTDQHLNPIIVNNELGNRQLDKLGVTLGTSQISYSLSQLGLWIACAKEHKGAVTCAYVDTRCRSNMCWIRITTLARTTTCKRSDVHPVTYKAKCTVFQVIRILVVVGLIFLLFGTSAQLVSLIVVKRSLAMLAGIVVFIAALLVLVAFVLFYVHIWYGSKLNDISNIGYSLILVIISFSLALVGGALSCLAASMGLRHKEVSDYTASNY